MTNKIEIFLSYADQDKELLEELKSQLRALARSVPIDIWDKQRISPGDERTSEITTHLNSAHVILVLISSDFLKSDELYHEMERAMERHKAGKARVIPVLLRSVSLRGTLIGELKPLPSNEEPVMNWSSRNDAFFDITQGVSRVVEQVIASQQAQPSTGEVAGKAALPTPQPSSPLADTSSYWRISSAPPLTDPQTIQQRESVVKDVYTKLTQPDITAIVLIGMGGIGKSTLAALVHKYAEDQRRAGKGPFKAESRWFRVDENTTFLDLIGNIFDTLGKPLLDFGHFAPQSQALALFNALNTVDLPRLIVLDQFENLLHWETGQALENRPGVGEFLDAFNSQSCTCRILFTSRPQPKGARPQPPSYMQPYPVKGFEIVEGIAQLRNRGVKGTDAELGTAVKRCDGHGLSLELLAALVDELKLPLSTLLDDPKLWDGDIASNLLNDIYTRQLGDLQHKILQAFSVYREAIPLDGAFAIMDKVTEAQVYSTLRGLLTQSLVQAVGEGRYQLHPIVASYARQHFVENDDHQANRQAEQVARVKAAQYYLQQATKSCPPLDKRRNISDVEPFIEAVWQLCQAEQWQEAYDLMEQERIFADLKRWGNGVTLLELYQLLPLDKWPQRSQAARIFNDLGWLYSDLGQKKQAQRYYDRALTIYREIGDRQGEGTSLNNLGLIYNVMGKKKEACQYYEWALNIHKELGDQEGIGRSLNNLGRVYGELGNTKEALRCFVQALEKVKGMSDRSLEGKTLLNLGMAYDALRRGDLALRCYEQALGIHREIRDRGEEGKVLNSLGAFYEKRKQYKKSLEYYKRALSIQREVRNRLWEGMICHNLGIVHYKLGEKNAALKYFGQALDIEREVGDRSDEGKTLRSIGILYFEGMCFDIALAYFLLAKNVFKDTGNPRHDTQGWIEKLRGKVSEEGFVALLAQVEPRASQIVEEALRKGA